MIEKHTGQIHQQLSSLAQAAPGSRWMIAKDGKIVPLSRSYRLFAGGREWLNVGNRANKKVVEYQFIKLLGSGASGKHFAEADVGRIEMAARQVGLIKGNTKSETGHPELNAMVELIATQILDDNPVNEKVYGALADRFYERNQARLKALFPKKKQPVNDDISLEGKSQKKSGKGFLGRFSLPALPKLSRPALRLPKMKMPNFRFPEIVMPTIGAIGARLFRIRKDQQSPTPQTPEKKAGMLAGETPVSKEQAATPAITPENPPSNATPAVKEELPVIAAPIVNEELPKMETVPHKEDGVKHGDSSNPESTPHNQMVSRGNPPSEKFIKEELEESPAIQPTPGDNQASPGLEGFNPHVPLSAEENIPFDDQTSTPGAFQTTPEEHQPEKPVELNAKMVALAALVILMPTLYMLRNYLGVPSFLSGTNRNAASVTFGNVPPSYANDPLLYLDPKHASGGVNLDSINSHSGKGANEKKK